MLHWIALDIFFPLLICNNECISFTIWHLADPKAVRQAFCRDCTSDLYSRVVAAWWICSCLHL